MSVSIKTSWSCYFCLLANDVEIEKPGLFTMTVRWVACKGCDSKFQIKWSRVVNAKTENKIMRVSYTTMRVMPSAMGTIELNKRTATKPPIEKLALTEGEKS